MHILRLHFTSATRKYISPSGASFDPSKHVIKLDFVSSPNNLLIMETGEAKALYKDKDAQYLLLSRMNAVKESRGESVLVIESYELEEDPRVVVSDTTIKDIRAGARSLLPDGRKRVLPRPDFEVRVGSGPIKAETDFVDYVLSFCGSSSSDYWASDVDSIIFDHRADSQMPLAVKIDDAIRYGNYFSHIEVV